MCVCCVCLCVCVLCFVFCGVCVCFVFCVLCLCVVCGVFCVLESDKKTKHMKALVVIFDRNVFIFDIQTNSLTQTIPTV